MYYTFLNTPVGEILLTKKQNILHTICFPKKNKQFILDSLWEKNNDEFSREIKEIIDYFSGRLKKFSKIPLPKGTDFQQKIWKALLDIPYGATMSYQEIAKAAGSPKGARAAGNALNINPIPIIIPCHRVIGKNGSLTGFGGGLNVKKYLLDLEQKFSK